MNGLAVDLSEPADCSLTEVYFAASQQIHGSSGIRFFIGASDWGFFFGQIRKKKYILLGEPAPIVRPVGIIEKGLRF